MPDNLPLFEPMVLAGVVEKLTAPEALVMTRRLPKRAHPYPVAAWDVIHGSRQVAKPNVPNSEAHIVPTHGRSQESASFIYTREKKTFQPTTLHWLRKPGTASNLEKAEEAVLREVNDLNLRVDNFVEWCIWQALTGQIVLDTPQVQATVDFKFAPSHKPTVSTSWASATPEQIVDDVTAWKRLISRDGRVVGKEAYTTDMTMSRIFRAFAANSASLLSDRSKDEYYRSGTLPGFLQMDWNIVDSYYDLDNGDSAGFLPDDAIVLGNFDEGRPIELLEGPTADDEAPEGYTGKFSKSWKSPDPSSRQILLEYHFLPVITRPEQFVFVGDVAP